MKGKRKSISSESVINTGIVMGVSEMLVNCSRSSSLLEALYREQKTNANVTSLKTTSELLTIMARVEQLLNVVYDKLNNNYNSENEVKKDVEAAIVKSIQNELDKDIKYGK